MNRSGPETPTPGAAEEDDAAAAIASGIRRLSLKTSLIILLAVALMPAGGLAIGQAISNLRSAETLQREADLARLSVYQTEVDALLVRARSVLRFIADDIGPAPEPSPACNALMRRVVAQDESFLAAHLTDENGLIRCGDTLGFQPVDVSDRATYRLMRSDPQSHITVTFGKVSKRLVLIVAEPLSLETGFRGFVSISITLETIDGLTKITNTNGEGRFAIFDTATASLPLASDDQTNAVESPAEAFGWLPEADGLKMLIQQRPAVLTLDQRGGGRSVFASAPMSDQTLTAIGAWPESSLLNQHRLQTILAVALPVSTWILASLIAYFAVDRLVISNMRRLTGLAASLRKGELDARADLSGAAPSEFVELSSQFNDMADRIEQRDARLRRAVQDERMLLREVYHRVKNNLQLIVSLLNLQARNAKSEDERRLIRHTQDRVQSLALVHQNLYQAGQLSEARLDHIIDQIVSATNKVRGPDDGAITTRMDLEPISVDADRAVPTAMLATEALQNAFKHGFPPGQDGSLSITLRGDESGGFTLEIINSIPSDTDAPAETQPEFAVAPSIGANLMKGFARQLRATMTQGVKNGRFVVRLQAPPQAEDDEREEEGEPEPAQGDG